MNHMGFQPPGAFITHLMKCGFRRHGPINTIDDFEIHNLDLTSLNLDVGILVPFLISKRLSGHRLVSSEQVSEVLPDLDRAGLSLQKKLLVLVVGGKIMELESQIVEDLRLLGVAIMDRTTIEAVCGTDDREVRAKALSTPLVRFLGREFLSPYVSGRPAIGGRFFGRSSLVNRMLPSAGNFTIVGNRRIRKSSLLKEIRERLKLQNVRTAEVYGATCASTQEVVYKLLMNLERYRDAEHILAEPQRTKNLAAYIHKISDTEKRPVAVFIDEVDRILEFDAEQDYEVLHLLRETFEGHQFCRVFLAGFRKIMEAMQTRSAPLFNFTRLIELPLFSREESYQMVTKPLERLGIEVANTDLPAAIHTETGGHPELIQIHCAAIVRYVQNYDSVPSGTDLRSAVFDTEEYKQKVLGTFLANTNAYEALLCYLLFADAEKTERSADYEFGPKDVNRVLTATGIKLGIPTITWIITNLKVSGIIVEVGGTSDRYRFSASQLVNYCVGLDLLFCIEESLELVREQENDKSVGKRHGSRRRATLWTEPEDIEGENLGIERDLRAIAPSESAVLGSKVTKLTKHIYIVPGGGAIVTEPEGVTTLSGTIDRHRIEDLNLRCLEMLDRWTDHKTFEQKLRGIGNQLSDALKIGIPELPKHFKPKAEHEQLVIATDAEGLKIPFELLPIEKSHLATATALSRRKLPTTTCLQASNSHSTI